MYLILVLKVRCRRSVPLSCIVIVGCLCVKFCPGENWVKELRKMLGDSCELCIVGNKMDLENKRTVSAREAEE